MTYELHTDGGSRHNPGPAGIGWIIVREQRTLHAYGYGFIGDATNNVAEYAGLIAGLEYAQEHDLFPLLVRADNKNMIEQMQGKAEAVVLAAYHQQASVLIQGREVSFEWCRRLLNQSADQLVNKAINERSSYTVVEAFRSNRHDPYERQLLAKHRASFPYVGA